LGLLVSPGSSFRRSQPKQGWPGEQREMDKLCHGRSPSALRIHVNKYNLSGGQQKSEDGRRTIAISPFSEAESLEAKNQLQKRFSIFYCCNCCFN
jgi:hypothetical protein